MVGGAIQKLRKLCSDKKALPEVFQALEQLDNHRSRRHGRTPVHAG